MKTNSDLLLTFLLNGLWQIPLIAGAAALGAWSVRESSAKYRHWIWASALLLSLMVPVFATSRLWLNHEPAPVVANDVFRTDFVALEAARGPFTDNATAVTKPSAGFCSEHVCRRSDYWSLRSVLALGCIPAREGLARHSYHY
jgi:hypothetical protein